MQQMISVFIDDYTSQGLRDICSSLFAAETDLVVSDSASFFSGARDSLFRADLFL